MNYEELCNLFEVDPEPPVVEECNYVHDPIAYARAVVNLKAKCELEALRIALRNIGGAK